MKKHAAHIHVRALAADKHQGCDGVGDDAHGGDGHDDPGPDRLGLNHPMDRLNDNAARDEHQHYAVGQCGQDGRLAEPIGTSPFRGSAGQPGRAACQDQSQHIRQIMTRIGDQGGGVGEQPGDHLDLHD